MDFYKYINYQYGCLTDDARLGWVAANIGSQLRSRLQTHIRVNCID